MKQKVNEVLDSLIAAHRIETPIRETFHLKHKNIEKKLFFLGLILVVVAGLWIGPSVTSVTSQGISGNTVPICSVETQKPQISLTFDTAVDSQDMDGILSILEQHNIKATFFMTGDWVENHPEKVKAIWAAGHDLGNHGQEHRNMVQLSDSKKKEEIMKVHTNVKSLTGYEMFLFRPPYGEFDDDVVKITYQSDYYPVLWNIDSLDWKEYGVDSIMESVCENQNLSNGSIVLMHIGSEYTMASLETMIITLQEKGYELVPLSELIYKKDYHMNAEGRQISENK